MAKVVIVQLNNGARMPVIRLGLAAEDIIVSKGSPPIDHIKSLILRAIQLEGILGESWKDAIQKGLVSRVEVFVTSKLGATDCYPRDVILALRKSLGLSPGIEFYMQIYIIVELFLIGVFLYKTLKLQYLDLYLIHIPLALNRGALYPHITPEKLISCSVSVGLEGCW